MFTGIVTDQGEVKALDMAGDLKARIFWHMDEHHIGTTENDHRLTVAPSDGEHLLTLTDEQGRQLVRTFNVTSGKRPH